MQIGYCDWLFRTQRVPKGFLATIHVLDFLSSTEPLCTGASSLHSLCYWSPRMCMNKKNKYQRTDKYCMKFSLGTWKLNTLRPKNICLSFFPLLPWPWCNLTLNLNHPMKNFVNRFSSCWSFKSFSLFYLWISLSSFEITFFSVNWVIKNKHTDRFMLLTWGGKVVSPASQSQNGKASKILEFLNATRMFFLWAQKWIKMH